MAIFERSIEGRWYRAVVDFGDRTYLFGHARGTVATAYRVDVTIRSQVGKIAYQKTRTT